MLEGLIGNKLLRSIFKKKLARLMAAVHTRRALAIQERKREVLLACVVQSGTAEGGAADEDKKAQEVKKSRDTTTHAPKHTQVYVGSRNRFK